MTSYQSRLSSERFRRIFGVEKVKTVAIYSAMFLICGLVVVVYVQDRRLKVVEPELMSCQEFLADIEMQQIGEYR